jgi:hypothetical protein
MICSYQIITALLYPLSYAITLLIIKITFYDQFVFELLFNLLIMKIILFHFSLHSRPMYSIHFHLSILLSHLFGFIVSLSWDIHFSLLNGFEVQFIRMKEII